MAGAFDQLATFAIRRFASVGLFGSFVQKIRSDEQGNAQKHHPDGNENLPDIAQEHHQKLNPLKAIKAIAIKPAVIKAIALPLKAFGIFCALSRRVRICEKMTMTSI